MKICANLNEILAESSPQNPNKFRKRSSSSRDTKSGQRNIPRSKPPSQVESGTILHPKLSQKDEPKIASRDVNTQRPVLRHPLLLIPEVKVFKEERIFVREFGERVARNELGGS